MSEWVAKRFWKSAIAEEVDGRFQVLLDGRVVKTPAKQVLSLPTEALSQAIAIEWDAQEDVIDPQSMPLTRLANSALDKVTPQHRAVADLIAEYGGSDLLCYRAERPTDLVERQANQWDPVLAWAAKEHGITLRLQSGVMPIEQPAVSLRQILDLTHALDPFALTAFHELVSLSGSWVLGLAALQDYAPADELWSVACLDELFQMEQWGEDEEASVARAAKNDAFLCAYRFAKLVGR